MKFISSSSHTPLFIHDTQVMKHVYRTWSAYLRKSVDRRVLIFTLKVHSKGIVGFQLKLLFLDC